MRLRFIVPVLGAVLLAPDRPVQAGLYNTEDPGPPWSGRLTSDEPAVWPTVNLEQFLYVARQLRDVVAPQSSLRQLYDVRIAGLEAKNRAGALTTEDRVNLSAYYLRTPQPANPQRNIEKAFAILEPVKNQNNFMVLSNLGMTNELSGDLDRALSYSEQALSAWPLLWPGLTSLQLNLLHRAESLHVALLKARLVEQRRRPPKRDPAGETLDALFPKVRFTRADGSYKTHGLEPAQLATLPEETMLLLQQLLLWNPGDSRLWWLFGELLNAQGNLLEASNLFDWLVRVAQYSPKELREHRAILNAAREGAVKLFNEQGNLAVLLWGLTPRGATLEGIGTLANEAGTFVKQDVRRMMQTGPTVIRGADPNAPASPPRQGKSLMQDLRTVAVSFVAGCLVTLLIVFQLRETRRRFQSAAEAKSEA